MNELIEIAYRKMCINSERALISLPHAWVIALRLQNRQYVKLVLEDNNTITIHVSIEEKRIETNEVFKETETKTTKNE
jgi:antitoxin component of MazEF toxin-antitoxin module